MKWLVIWVVVNMWIVPCPIPPATEDEYGRSTMSNTELSVACWDTEAIKMQKEFESYGSAYKWMVNAQVDCHQCSEFTIFKKKEN